MSQTPTPHRFSERVYSFAPRLLSSSLWYFIAPLLIVLALAPAVEAQSGVRAYILGIRTVGSTESQRDRSALRLEVPAPPAAGYSGTTTSPFFRQATSVQGTRKIDIGMSLTF